MKHYLQQATSFEYKPIQTDMGNNDHDASEPSINDNTMRFSQMNYIIEEEPFYRASFDSKKEIESFDSLHSLRVSRSVSGKKDNERTLLERMNLIRSINQMEEETHTPEKKQQDKIVIGALFDYSSTNNKNVMVSELDIQISSNKKIKSKLEESNRSTQLNTFSFQNKKNLMEVFNSKLDEILPARIVIDENNYMPHITEVEKSPIMCYKSKNLGNTNKKQGSNEIDKGKKIEKVSSSMKKISSKKSIFDILQKINDKHIPIVSKNKNLITPLSTLSTAVQDISNKRSSYFKNPIPSERGKKAEIPYISSFQYKETKYAPRTSSFKQKNSSLKELENLTNKLINKSKSKKDCSLNYKITNNTTNKSIRTSTISNSRSKSKQNNLKKEKDEIFFNFHYSIFHTIQSLKKRKAKNSILYTIPSKKNTTKTYYPLKSSCLSKEKQLISKKAVQSSIIKKQIKDNHSYQCTENDKLSSVHRNDHSKSQRNKVQLQTPINAKPHIQIYKNNSKHIMITPMNSLRMKLMQSQGQKSIKSTKKNYINSGYSNFHVQTEN